MIGLPTPVSMMAVTYTTVILAEQDAPEAYVLRGPRS